MASVQRKSSGNRLNVGFYALHNFLKRMNTVEGPRAPGIPNTTFIVDGTETLRTQTHGHTVDISVNFAAEGLQYSCTKDMPDSVIDAVDALLRRAATIRRAIPFLEITSELNARFARNYPTALEALFVKPRGVICESNMIVNPRDKYAVHNGTRYLLMANRTALFIQPGDTGNWSVLTRTKNLVPGSYSDVFGQARIERAAGASEALLQGQL